MQTSPAQPALLMPTPDPHYDESLCFSVYLEHGGSCEECVKWVESLEGGEKTKWPSRKTWYNYQQSYKWKQRYEAAMKAFIEKANEEVPVNSRRAGTLVGLTYAGLVQRLREAYEAKDWKQFTPKMFQICWEIYRTERGLPKGFTAHESSHYSEAVYLESVMVGRREEEFKQILSLYTKEELLQFLKENCINPEPPNLVR